MKKKSKPKAQIDSSVLYCSFCGNSQHDVEKLIAGPLVFICDECVVLCLDIILVEEPKSKAKRNRTLKKLKLFTSLLLDKYEPIVDELIEKGHHGSIDNLVYDFLIHAVDSHNRLAGINKQKPIDPKRLKLPLHE